MPEDFTSSSDKESQIGGYVLLSTIGKGSYAKVMLAHHVVTGAKVAVKIVNRQGSSLGFQELQCLKKLDHPNITKLFEVITTDDHYFFFMEHLSGGELFDHLEKHGAQTEEEARTLFRQLLSALHHCHQKGFVHRDLKPENILLDADHNIKLADFGFSKEHYNNKLSSFCGTVTHMAPEILRNQPYDGPKADIWSLGVILYNIVTGRLPFEGNTFGEVKRRVLKGHFLLPSFVSEECQKLLKNIITLDPAQRPTLDAIIRDPWVTRGEEEGVKLYREPPYGDIDPHITESMQYLGYNQEEIRDSVAHKTFNNIMGTYLILHSSKKSIKGHAVRVRPCSFPDQRRHHSTSPEMGAAAGKTNRPTSPPTKVAARVAIPATSVAPRGTVCTTSVAHRVATASTGMGVRLAVLPASTGPEVATRTTSVQTELATPSASTEMEVDIPTPSDQAELAIPSASSQGQVSILTPSEQTELTVTSASTEMEVAIPIPSDQAELAVPSVSSQGEVSIPTSSEQTEPAVPPASSQAELVIRNTSLTMELAVPSATTEPLAAIAATNLEPRVEVSTTSGEEKVAKCRTLSCPESSAAPTSGEMGALSCPESMIATLSPAFHHSSSGSLTTASSAFPSGSSGSLTTPGSRKTISQDSSSHHVKGQQQRPRRVLQFFLKLFCCRPTPSMDKKDKKAPKAQPQVSRRFWRVKIGPQ